MIELDITNEQLQLFFSTLKDKRRFTICDACGHYSYLISHHWYDIFDNKNELKTYYPRKITCPTFYNGERTLYYHEKNICYKCNRALTQGNIKHVKGGGVKHFKVSDIEHVMPSWDIQQAYIKKHTPDNDIVDIILDKLFQIASTG